jgi:hypothetical protein
MTLQSDTMTELIAVMVKRYQEQLGQDPDFLLLDDRSYATLKEETLKGVTLIRVELDFFMGMRVFHNDMGKTYILVT